MVEEWLCFPTDELVFLMLVEDWSSCLGKVAMEVSGSCGFISGGRVVMFN